MRLPQSSADTALLATLLFPLLSSAISIDCTTILVDKVGFDLSPLGGPRSVINRVDNGPSWLNTTYTIDVCRPLKKAKNTPSSASCPKDTRVCAIERMTEKETNSNNLVTTWPVAGELKESGGGHMDPKWTRLKGSSSPEDAEKEGIRLEMYGGFKGTNKKKQKAIVDFICDKKKTGLENLYEPDDKYDDSKEKREEDKKEGSEADDDKTPSLQFIKYDETTDLDTLRLRWYTKDACEDAKSEKDAQGGHWGFFTWFVIIAFLSTAAYLIFGSWLNYNRYGARGWDLLPHGDAIRDVPYLVKDWTRRVVNSVQGGGSRGGYAAV
ncbi:autophagy protein-like protein Atg27 [Halenospora varia]|nr:autophagy protein-like protein Atg27 [Halenospora varia]